MNLLKTMLGKGEEKEVVLITGGSGFLGQHLVRELNEKHFEKVAEIRIADKQLFRNLLGIGIPSGSSLQSLVYNPMGLYDFL